MDSISLDFLEAYALADPSKRQDVINEKLTPETREAYHFNWLHLQVSGDTKGEKAYYDKVINGKNSQSGVLSSSIRSYSDRERLELRRQLSSFPSMSKSERTTFLKEIQQSLGLRFNDAKTSVELKTEVQYPSFLSFSEETILKEKLSSGISNFTTDQVSLSYLSKKNLSEAQVSHFLRNVKAPYVDGIEELVIRNSKHYKNSFGSIPIHRQLTMAQLLKLHKSGVYESDTSLISLIVEKMLPVDDIDTLSLSERIEYYQNVWSFVQGLKPVFDGIKVVVLHKWLSHLLKEGAPVDTNLFIQYLKLPRSSRVMSEDFRTKLLKSSSSLPSLSTRIGSLFSVPNNTDEPLIRGILELHFADASVKNTKSFSKYLDSNFLDMLFAEVKLTRFGDEEKSSESDRKKWLSALPRYQIDRLMNETRISFVKNNQKLFSSQSSVSLILETKNVKSLVVKIFEVNTRVYLQKNLEKVPADMNLDGLQPQQTFNIETDMKTPMHICETSLSLDSLKGRSGVFIVDVLGSGKNCRALIRKGNLVAVERRSIGGHLFRIYNEEQKAVSEAYITLDGRKFTSNKRGDILIPYSSSSKTQTILLCCGPLTILDSFYHLTEEYEFTCGLFLDREALVPQTSARLLLRPSLTLNGLPVSLKAIEKAIIKVETVDAAGTPSTKTVDDYSFASDDTEHAFDFPVPENLRVVNVSVSVKVKRLSDGKNTDLSLSKSWEVNGIHSSKLIGDVYLRETEKGYFLTTIGKSGEIKGGVHVSIQLHHEYLTSSLSYTLQSDSHGVVFLGPLPHISKVDVTLPASRLSRSFSILDQAQASGAEVETITGTAGTHVLIPYSGRSKTASSDSFALLRTVGGSYVSDETNHIDLTEDGCYIALKPSLSPGQYTLFFKEDLRSNIDVCLDVGEEIWEGKVLLSKTRLIELPSSTLQPMIRDTNLKKDHLEVRLSNSKHTTRLHVVATHFYPERSIYSELLLDSTPEPEVTRLDSFSTKSEYLKQRDVSDEQRYILDRQQAEKRVGNMLERPSLLLNDRIRGSTNLDDQPTLRDGTAFEKEKSKEKKARSSSMKKKRAMRRDALNYSTNAYGGRQGVAPSGSSSVEFLRNPCTLLLNLPPNQNGSVIIPLADLRSKGFSSLRLFLVEKKHVSSRVVAIDDGFLNNRPAVLGKNDVGEEKKMEDNAVEMGHPSAYTDARLYPGLDISKNLTEMHLISPLRSGDSLSIPDVQTAKIVMYDSIQDLFRYYSTVATGSISSSLDEFEFVQRWTSLSMEEKSKKYSQYACHELNFFLFRRDFPFFEAVVRPHLQNKPAHSRQIVDHYLLNTPGADMTRYLQMHVFDSLNVLEKILLADIMQQAVGGTDHYQRYFKERGETLKVDREVLIRLFKIALQTKAQVAPDVSDLSGAIGGAGDDLFEPMMDMMVAEECEAAPPPMSAPAPMMMQRAFGGGGRGGRGGARMAMKSMAPVSSMSAAYSLSSSGLMGDEEVDEDCPFDSDASSDDEYETYGKRDEREQLYRGPESTKELEETQYWGIPADQNATHLVPWNHFWVEYALYTLEGTSNRIHPSSSSSFLSEYALLPTSSFTEIIFALSVCDLPFASEAKQPESTVVGVKYTLKAISPLIVFNRQVRITPTVPSSISVSQNYFDPADRYQQGPEGNVDKYIEKEFLPGKPYVCRVVLTNVSSQRQKAEVLLQIPEGSLPVAYDSSAVSPHLHTQTVFVDLSSYSTQVLEYSFYFPSLGKYRHYPVQVSRKGNVVGHGESLFPLEVVLRSTSPPDLTSWRYVSQEASSDAVVAYLQHNNPFKVDLNMIAWRFVSQSSDTLDFFRKVTAVLRSKKAYNNHLWSYGIHHGDQQTTGEYLSYHPLIRKALGPHFSSSLVSVDAFEELAFQHLEYTPLINQRVHSLQTANREKGPLILNRQFKDQYRRFLFYLSHLREPLSDPTLRMAQCYYFLLMDRVPEAIRSFKSVSVAKARETAQLQYDYLAAYLDFFSPTGPSQARQIASKYDNYPVMKKQKMFRDILEQLDEIEYVDVKSGNSSSPSLDEEKKGGEKMDVEKSGESEKSSTGSSKRVSKEKALDLSIEASSITIAHTNIHKCVINFYVMDIELLFSTNPFIGGTGGDSSKFLYVSPNHTLPVSLSQEEDFTQIPIPDYCLNKNVYVEVVGDESVSRSQAFYSHSLTLQMFENFGQFKITQQKTGRPIPSAYVKVYAKKNDGSVVFYKDGYTDLRGRFDYVSISADMLSSVEKFSVLILSEEYGAVVREARRPAT